MKIAILTLAVGAEYRKCMRAGFVSKRYYARRHGFSFIIGGDSWLDPSRPCSWSKIQFVRAFLPNFDCVFLSDADVIIMNPQIDLRDLVREHMQDKAVMLSRDYNNLNAGNVFFRNVPEAFEILDRVHAQRHLTFHKWSEQAAYIELYETDAFVREHLRVVDDQRLFNSYPTFLAHRYPDHCYRQGDLLIHFADLWKEQAAVRMSESLGILRRSLGPTTCPQRSL